MKVKFKRFIYNLAIDRIKIPSWLAFVGSKEANPLIAKGDDGKKYIVADSKIYPYNKQLICDTSKAIVYNPLTGEQLS